MNSFLIDVDLIPLFEEAEGGNIEAQIDLCNAFWEGKGVKKNYDKARQYHFLILKTLKKKEESKLNTRLKLSTIWNLGILEKDVGNYEKMKEKFNDAIDYMQEKIPMEEWDFSLFDLMEQHTQFLN